MLDKHGLPVRVGAQVRFAPKDNSDLREGWVRAVRNDGMFARVDDGDPNNEDPHTNGFHVATWVEPQDIEVLPVADDIERGEHLREEEK